jgi:hypothetical protein
MILSGIEMGNYYGDLKGGQYLILGGPPAEAAVDCMRKENILPAESGLKGRIRTEVAVNESGEVTVEQMELDGKPGEPIETRDARFDPEGYVKGQPAAIAHTPQVYVTGPLAERMREKARSCVVNSFPVKP